MTKKKVAKAKKADSGIKPENYFVLNSGGVIKSIEELASTLEFMSDDEFRYHANAERNDFANWIKDIFSKKELGDKIAAAGDRKDALIVLLKYMLNNTR